MSEVEGPGQSEAVKPKRRLRSPKTWLIVGAAVVLLAAVGFGSFSLFRPKPTASTTRTQSVEVTSGTQTATVAFDGTLSPRTKANLNFSVSGQVTSVTAKVGAKVTKGQALAKIDSSSLSNALAVAEANLSSARANYSDISSSGTSAAIKAASAQVDSAKASVDSATQDLTSATLRSSIDGTVASVDLSVGDQISGSGSSSSGSSGSGSSGSGSSGVSTTSSSSSAQVVVISTATWKLEGSVGASDLSSLKAGQAAKVTVGSTELDGTVASVGIVATSTSNGAATFPIVINVSGKHSNLYSGTTATAKVTTGTYQNVVTVPTAAITSQNGSTVVEKVNATGGTTVTRVEVGRVFGNLTEITSGLSAGDTVQVTFRPSSTSSASSSGFGGFGGFGGGAPPADGGPQGGNR